jgi:hypothetical protein
MTDGMKKVLFIAVIIGATGLLRCMSWSSFDQLADSSTQDITTVSGTIYQPDGKRVAGASVAIRSRDYLPELSGLAKRAAEGRFFARTKKTDGKGYFAFTPADSIPKGLFIMEAHDSLGNRCLIGDTIIDSVLYLNALDSTPYIAFKDTLKPPATIKGTIKPLLDSVRAGVGVYGLDQWTDVSPDGEFLLPGLPEGRLRMAIIVMGNIVTYDTIPVRAKSGEWTTIHTTVSSLPHLAKRYSLTLTANGNGNVLGPDSIAYAMRDSIVAIPDSGYHFVAWRVIKGMVSIADPSDAATAIAPAGGDATLEAVIQRNIFPKMLGQSGNAMGNFIQQTTDKGFIIAGIAYFPEDDETYLYLVKSDSSGNELWNKTYGIQTEGQGNTGCFVQQTNDGGFIATGDASRETYLVKTDANGDSIWTRIFSLESGSGQGHWVRETSDGGFLIGIFGGYGKGEFYYFGLLKTDARGIEIWTKTFKGFGFSFQPTSDNGYIIIGESLTKTDPSGNLTWTKQIHGNDIRQTRDGGYIVVYDTLSSANKDIRLIKTDHAGDIQWIKAFDMSDWDCSNSVRQTTDGGYIIAGSSDFPEENGSRVSLIKTDWNGNEVWKKAFAVNGTGGASVQQTYDGGYIVTGGCAGGVFLLKTDKNGNVQ